MAKVLKLEDMTSRAKEIKKVYGSDNFDKITKNELHLASLFSRRKVLTEQLKNTDKEIKKALLIQKGDIDG